MSSVACSGTPPLITATRRVIFFLPGLTHFFPHPVDEGINQPSLKGFCRVDFGAKITRRVNERDGREIKTPRQKLGPGMHLLSPDHTTAKKFTFRDFSLIFPPLLCPFLRNSPTRPRVSCVPPFGRINI